MTTYSVKNEAIQLDISGIAGDTLDNWKITFEDSNGVPLDISSYQFYLIVKKSFKELDSAAVISKGPSDAVLTASDTVVDTMTFPLTPTDTEITPGTYVYAIKFSASGEERTWVEGSFTIERRRIDTI